MHTRTDLDLGLAHIASLVAADPALGVILVLVLGVTAVSGATDAPNAIATAVSTRCLTPNQALVLAAIFNFVGLVGMTYVSTAVAHTMFNMVDFSGDTHQALMALMAAMIGAIIWGVFCWFLGIPASKSHSLIAGITGGAIAMNGWGGVVIGEWGVTDHTTDGQADRQHENATYYCRFLVSEARKRGFSTFVWDNNAFGNGQEKFGIFDRDNDMKVKAPWILKGIID